MSGPRYWMAVGTLAAYSAAGSGKSALAQEKSTNAKPAAQNAAQTTGPAVEITDATPLDIIVQEASEEDRARMLMRCIGPPPKMSKEMVASLKPASEPAVIAGTGDIGG